MAILRGVTTTDRDPGELVEALLRLAALVETCPFELPGPEQGHRRARRDEAATVLREHLVPRLRDLDAPALVVLVGSTGAGKSTLLNSLAGDAVTTSSAVRPTTREPVVWSHRRHRHRYGADLLPGFATGERSLRVVAHDDPRFADVTVVDTPDLDSVVVEHRAIADEVVAAADLCVWVTTAQRYADAVPWDVLRGARARGVPLLVVLNRVPDGAADAVTGDLRRRLQEAAVVGDTAAVEVVTVPEQAGAGARLPAALVAGFADAVAALGDTTRRTAVVETALRASLAHATEAGRHVADDVDRERADAEALAEAATGAYDRQATQLSDALRDGRVIHREVLDRWQAFVGAGEILRSLSAGASRVRTWARQVFGGGPRTETVRHEATSELAATIARHADRAATDTATAWELSPIGRTLLATQQGRLWRADPTTDDRAEALLDRWQDELAARVESEGADRRKLARLASLGVNGTAAVLMLAVFAQTGGLTGAEVGITAGAATVQQRILEHVFGTAAARSLVSGARESLATGVAAVLDQDRDRFLALLRDHTAEPGHDARLREAVAAVKAASRRFLGEARHG